MYDGVTMNEVEYALGQLRGDLMYEIERIRKEIYDNINDIAKLERMIKGLEYRVSLLEGQVV
jgi:hypothetical protein